MTTTNLQSNSLKLKLVPKFKKGSSIHIKKQNRGKFTEYCGGKVTQECIEKGKHSPDPKIRKRATFAANSRRWSHKVGGTVSVLDSNKDMAKRSLKLVKKNKHK